MTYCEEITCRIKAAKERSGKTLQRLSEDSGLSQSTIEQYFYNGVMPTAEKLGLLCRALGVSADGVLGLDDK